MLKLLRRAPGRIERVLEQCIITKTARRALMASSPRFYRGNSAAQRASGTDNEFLRFHDEEEQEATE